MKPLYSHTATELINRMRQKEVCAEDVAVSCLERIEKLEPHLRAWVCYDKEETLVQARAVDEAVARGDYRGRLRGVPIGVKDVFNTADFPTEMGSHIWQGFKPGNDARAVFNVRYDGGVVVGKTKTSEFAVHEPTDTHNPHRFGYAPGTSSSGSAAAVAAGMVPLALGTQTAGSIIRPASYCGVFGFKPTFGLVPRTGVLKTTDTLDTVSWIARSLDDIELFFEVVRVSGLNYPLVNKNVVRRPLGAPVRLGLVRGPHWNDAEPYAQEALLACAKKLVSTGVFVVDEVELPGLREIYDEHDVIYCKALSYYFKGEKRNSRENITRVLMEMLERGDKITPTDYLEAVQRQVERTERVQQGFSHDAWITLSAAGEAPRGLRTPDKPDTCKIWTYLGLPSLSVPLFTSPCGLPLGLQVVGRKYSDYVVIDAARKIWEAAGGSLGIVNPEEASIA